METQFTKLNHGWNAFPNGHEVVVHIEGNDIYMDIPPNTYKFKEFKETDVIRLSFHNTYRFRVGKVNDHGWDLGQCRFSKLAPKWGEFYEVSGDLRFEECPEDWQIVNDVSLKNTKHFLFYFRDNEFECDAESWTYKIIHAG